MAWSTPRTWSTGELVTAAHLNQELRDNLAAAFPLGVDAWTAYTPTLTQSNTVTKTVARAVYTRVGRLITCTFYLAVTGSGTAGNTVVAGLPVEAASANSMNGAGQIFDTSTTTRYGGLWIGSGATAVVLAGDWAGASGWGVNPNVALASGDVITGTITYEAAT